VAIAALVLWIGTVAIGTYLLATATRISRTKSAPAEPVPVSAGPTPPAQAAQAAQAEREKDPFAPLSLQLDREAPPPGLRELAEFAHPALAIIGMAFWVGYVISRDRIMLAIGLGILLGAIAAGLSWFTVNRRAAKRAATEDPATENQADDADEEDLSRAPLSFTPLVLILHTAGAALTLLFVVLIVAHV
jgi:hypothetical protein